MSFAPGEGELPHLLAIRSDLAFSFPTACEHEIIHCETTHYQGFALSGIAQHPKHSKFHLVLDLGTVKLDTNSIHSETQGVPQNTEYEKGFKKVVADIISPSFYVI